MIGAAPAARTVGDRDGADVRALDAVGTEGDRNAVYNAIEMQVCDYPSTLDKHLDRLPAVV